MIRPLNELGYDAEFSLVGLLMVYCDRVPIPHGMTVEWYGNWIARTVFGAIDTVVRRGHMPDLVAVAGQLRDSGQMERIGGEQMLIEIAEASGSPSQVEGLVAQLKLGLARRKVKEVGDWIAGLSVREDLDTGDISIRLLEASAIVSGSSGSSPVYSIADVDHLGDDMGVTTGYPVLDAHMSCGGYPCGQMTVISAYHKGGKSTMKLSSAVHQLRAGKRVLWATFADLDRRQIKRRILRNLCGWSKAPTQLELLREYDDALDWVKSAPLDVYDASAIETGYDVETFAAWLRAHHDARGYDCVFVDYAQKLRSARRMDRFAVGDYCSDLVQRLAASTRLPIVVGSQITPGNSRDGEETKTKGSRAWEEDAGWVWRLKREGDLVTVDIPYSRFGPSGGTELRWNGDRLRVEDSNG